MGNRSYVRAIAQELVQNMAVQTVVRQTGWHVETALFTDPIHKAIRHRLNSLDNFALTEIISTGAAYRHDRPRTSVYEGMGNTSQDVRSSGSTILVDLATAVIRAAMMDELTKHPNNASASATQ